MLLWIAGALAHLVVVAAAAWMAGIDSGEYFHGGRSTVKLGVGVAVHGRRIWWVCSTPGSVMSALMGSDASGNSCGCGGAMAGSDVLAGSAVRLVRARNGR